MSKALTKVSKITHKIQDLVWSGSLALGTCMCSMAAFADEKSAMIDVVKILGKIVCIPGAFFLIFGLVHYAEARSEGDGPAKNKSMLQITSGIMVLIVGIMLATATESNAIGKLISNFIVS